MKKKWILPTLIAVIVLGGAGFVCIKYYTYVFSKTITGEIVRVERVTQPQAIIGGDVPREQIFSFAVAVRDEKGEIHTSSSEDRQWAVATPGQCAQVKMFPYAPWELEKGSTYYNARLERLFDCPKK